MHEHVENNVTERALNLAIAFAFFFYSLFFFKKKWGDMADIPIVLYWYNNQIVT
jgi:hypothetical protein